MQPENIIQNDSPHPNYKRVIILVTVLFLIIIAGAFAYQYFMNKKVEKARDLVLREQYRTEQLSEVQKFMMSASKTHTALDDKTKKVVRDFFAKAQPQPSISADSKQLADLAEQGYQNWKASHQ